MYDFQVVVPCIKSRLKFFQKFGLHNIQNTKILIYCLVSNKKDFLDGWPKEVDVEFIEFENDQPAHKIYDFLSKFTIDQAMKSKWFLKIDDDSYNDFYNMNKYLDKYYDCERDYYLVGEIRHDNDRIEAEILKKMNLFDDYKMSGWQHEIEACIISRFSMKKIINNQNCINLFKERANIARGYTDQCLGLAASFCKIYPTVTHLMTTKRNDNLLKFIFSEYEGRINDKDNFGTNKMKNFVHYHPIKKESISQ